MSVIVLVLLFTPMVNALVWRSAWWTEAVRHWLAAQSDVCLFRIGLNLQGTGIAIGDSFASAEVALLHEVQAVADYA